MRKKYRDLSLFLVASFISLLFSVLIGIFQVVEHKEVEPLPEEKMQRIFSPEDLEKMFREEDIVFQESAIKLREKYNESIFLEETKAAAAWLSWLPWFFIPFFSRKSGSKSFLFLSVIPISLMLVGIFSFIEISLFALAFYAGWIISRSKKNTWM